MTTTDDFFTPATNYLLRDPYRAPEIRPEFQCVAVAVHPSKGERRAFGFWRSGSQSSWLSHAMHDSDWAEGWFPNQCPECCAPAVGNTIPEHKPTCPTLDPHH
jgi:hypothetical protein